MTLVVSNIAWAPEEEYAVAATLQRLGVTAVEIAPTKVFRDPLDVSDAELHRYLGMWGDHGIRVVAFQSMLFGRPDLTIFDDPATRDRTAERLAGFLRLGGRMGIGPLVFGSPKNRKPPPGMTPADAFDIATAFFAGLAETAEETGTLANALLGHHPELAGIGYSALEPGIVHRLDTDTSGLVVVARTKAAFGSPPSCQISTSASRRLHS